MGHTPASSQGGSYTPQLMSSDGSTALGSGTGANFDPEQIKKVMDGMSRDQLAKLLVNHNINPNAGKPHTPTPPNQQHQPFQQRSRRGQPTVPDPHKVQRGGWQTLDTQSRSRRDDGDDRDSRDYRSNRPTVTDYGNG